MRKVKSHCATSLDGFVALRDGGFDRFSMQGPHVDDFIATIGTYDAVLMGRRTFDVGAMVLLSYRLKTCEADVCA